MPLLEPLNQLKIPIVGSPLFIISNPDLVLAKTKSGFEIINKGEPTIGIFS